MRTAISGATLATLLLLTGCGSDAEPTAETTNSAADGAPGGFDSGQFDQIRDCLEAAGLEDAFPTDIPTDLPTDRPTGAPPEGFDPANPPSGFPTDGAGPGGGGFGALQDPDVQAALQACGIELPQQPGASS
jgi:hypothetical protein